MNLFDILMFILGWCSMMIMGKTMNVQEIQVVHFTGTEFLIHVLGSQQQLNHMLLTMSLLVSMNDVLMLGLTIENSLNPIYRVAFHDIYQELVNEMYNLEMFYFQHIYEA